MPLEFEISNLVMLVYELSNLESRVGRDRKGEVDQERKGKRQENKKDGRET